MKQVLITGGSRGIGAAAVRLFSEAGCRVAFFYEKSRQAAEALAQQTGALPLQCDVADGEAVRAAVAQLPAPDVLINNAGIAYAALIQATPEQVWDRIFAVNVKGAFHTVSAVLPGMLKKQTGIILNVSSMWGQVGASCEVAYSASKGALIAMTRALAKELAPSGIRVNAVCPGVIDTDMNAQLSPDAIRALKEETPLARLGTPREVAQALWYLAGAEFVTGQILGINGGFVI